MQKLLSLLPGPVRERISALIGGTSENARSGRNALSAFLIRVASAGIAFLSQVLLARWLGAHEFGIYTYVWVWVVVAGTLCTAGFATSVIRFVPEYQTKGEYEYARGFLRTGRLVAFGSGALLGTTGFVFLWLWPGLVEDYYLLPLGLALICVPAFALMDYLDGVGRSQAWIGLALVPPYIVRPVLLFVFIGLALAFGFQKDAVTAMGAAIVATWLTCITQYLLQRRRLTQAVKTGIPRYRPGFWLKVSIPMFLLDGFALLMLNLDVLLLELFVEPDQIAIYYAAARTMALISFVHFAVTAAVMPRFAAAHAQNDIPAIRALLHEARKWTLLPSLAGALVLLALGKPILWLFGPEFTAGYPAMGILLFGLIARAAAGPAQGLLVVTGYQSITAWILGAAVIVNAALNLALIPSFGLIGAAIATATAFCFESLALFVVAIRTTRGDGKPAHLDASHGVAAE